jgi:site-specific DNA recombinase
LEIPGATCGKDGADHSDLHNSQRQAAISCIAQRAVNGRTCVKTYQDVGHSAGNLNRPALQELHADIAAGHIDCVVISSLDRLSRSMADLQELAAVFQQHGVMLVTVSGGSVDMSSYGFVSVNA